MVTLLISILIGGSFFIGIPLIAYAMIYNGLIGKKNQVENVFASMDAILKKRYDLIPNLIATVKQYASHEKETLETIAEMRAKATSGNLSDDERVQLDNQISGAIGRIMVAVEAYPDLKANENFMQLQRSLNEVEEQISASRRAYNSSVTDYNNAVEMVPSSVVAKIHHFQPKEWFEIIEAERETPKVAELFNS